MGNQVWVKVLQAFDCILVQPLKTWIRLDRDVSVLRGWDDTELRDIGINRSDIPAIRAGTYKRTSSDDAARTLTEHDPGSTRRRDERPSWILF